jgi:DNA polymerase
MKRLIAAAGRVKTPASIVMPRPAPSALESDIAAVLDWWRQAGVDATFADETHGWLREPEPEQDRAPSAKIPVPPVEPKPVLARQIGGPQEDWPQTLAAFRQWWLAEPSLDEGGLAPRVPPVGEADPELMVLVSMPEEVDRDALMTGPLGRLLNGFLGATGIAPAQVYRASAIARHTPLPDWAGLATDGLGKVIARHVALVRPKRLLVLGRNILPLCGHDPAQPAAALTFFNHEGGTVPALAEVGLERLLGNAQLRARLWTRWLDWTDG